MYGIDSKQIMYNNIHILLKYLRFVNNGSSTMIKNIAGFKKHLFRLKNNITYIVFKKLTFANELLFSGPFNLSNHK